MRINNILAFRNDRFGEFLLTVPALYALKQNYPAAKLDLVVDRNVLPIAERLPFINRLIVWENRKHGLGEIFRLSAELKKKRYDACLIFNPGKELNLISWLAGIPLRAGYNRKCAFLLNRRIKDKKSEGLKHEVDYNLELLSAVSKLSFPRKRESISLDCLPRLDRGIKPGNDINDIMEYISLDIKDSDFPDARIAEMGLSGNDFIAIHPWSSNPEKEMARDQFRDLCLRLSRETSCRIVVIGGREEAARSSEFCNGLAVIDLTGKTSLLELAGLLKRCGLLVTVDSGPMHLAAALGKTVVAIFRKNPPGVSARRWGPVGEKHIVIENERIEDIKTDEVLNGIRKAFSG